VTDPQRAVAAAIGHDFADESLLELALTHPSFDPEQAEPVGSNGRLEFLGDAVLDLVISSELYERWGLSEGEMTKVRAAVVDEATLAAMGVSIGIPAALRLGKGEDAAGGREKPAIVADAMEAVLAAVYLDAGFDVVRDVLLTLWGQVIEERVAIPGGRDHKSLLQEELARRGLEPSYTVTGSGPDHDRSFEASVLVEGVVVGTGSGTSKKRAEQAAALDALGGLSPPDA
jgi:ribonuclease III